MINSFQFCHNFAFKFNVRRYIKVGDAAPSHWVRPCMQLFVSRDDVRVLGAAVLELAPAAEAAAACAAGAYTRPLISYQLNVSAFYVRGCI